ncbi:hypothetical protein AK812_SmicGene23396 [Symbiodinium microadriaticum]|uniref:Uncharacterized protein n=1 Tax=Symbiodinium microadriaticum TaxID=2951 RepID=A0A1Q9DHA5_SYMMI|nr:hypothetical protein AK812_SmicGene23396 [Symbiodinium microadriaticum]
MGAAAAEFAAEVEKAVKDPNPDVWPHILRIISLHVTQALDGACTAMVSHFADHDAHSHDNQIHDILDDIRDLKDQMKSSQSQLAFLLYNEADRQRSAVAGKVMVKNWWQYNDPNEQGKHLLMEHRETMINAIAVEAGFSEKEITRFRFEHRRGKQLSPFTMVDLGDFALKQQLLESVNQKYDKKGIKEYSNEKLNHLQSGNNKDSVNGTIKIEPCISAFDRMQTEPLKAIMAVITKMTPTLQWKHSWKHLTIQNTDSGEYIAWLAYDHLEGMAKIYVNSTFYSARAFEDEFIAAYGNIMSRKVIGNKGKGKGNAAEGVLTTGDFLKAVGLTPEGKGSYVKVSTLTLKTKVPFIFDVRAIKNDEFGQKYDEHLNRRRCAIRALGSARDSALPFMGEVAKCLEEEA